MLIDDKSTNITIPNIVDNSDSSSISHEAYTGKMDEEKLFYLTSRGITLDKATSMIVN